MKAGLSCKQAEVGRSLNTVTTHGKLFVNTNLGLAEEASIAMHIARVHIENFRCFRDTSVDFVPGVNVIIGENNSGKTALLRAFGLIFNGSGRPRMQVFDFNQSISEFTQPPAITVTATLRSDGEGADGIEDKALVASWLVKLASPWEAQLTYRFALPDEENQQCSSSRRYRRSWKI